MVVFIMALHLEIQLLLGGPFVEVDLAAERVGAFHLKISDSHPAQLSFSVHQAQQTLPLGLRRFIKFWDDAGKTPDNLDQSNTNPLFEGWIWEAQPAASNRIDYVAYDPSHLAGREIPVMSTAWNPSTGGSSPPQPDADAVPRLILNATITNDVDYAFERAGGLNVGQMISLVMDDALHPLKWYNAAPASGSAYINLDLVNFIYQPQEKIVTTNESLRSFLDRLTQAHYPEYAFLWTPGTRLWHWYSRLAADTTDLILNSTDPNHYTVLGLELHRSLEGRYPAVKFYGPETAGPVEIFSTLDGTLQPIGSATQLETYIDAGGIGTVDVYAQYQIVDPAKRRGAKLLPTTYLVRDDSYHWVGTRSPMFEISFDEGDTWRAVESIWIDFQNGIFVCPEGVWPYFWSDKELEAGSNRHFWTPNAFRIVWAPFHEPITVRWPTTGFEGTSYSVADQQSELRIYDEMLAVGYNRIGIPVTTATRMAQFELLAQNIHAARKDLSYTGGATLEGLHYPFCRLNRRINIKAVDEHGVDLTTGWESIGALLTDVEYNFADQTTFLTFSQEALTAWGDSLDLLKERLRIGLVNSIRVVNAQYQFSSYQSRYTRGAPIQYVSGIVYNDSDLYYDPRLGTLESAL